MSANLKIREKPGELVVRVTELRDIKSILMNVSAGGVVALLFFHAFSGSTRVVAMGVTAVIIGMKIISAFGGADVELRVDNLDFVSTGHSPSDYQPSTIARADVSGLEFREANGGGAEFPDLPQGLYLRLGVQPLACCPTQTEFRLTRSSRRSFGYFRIQVHSRKPAMTSRISRCSI